jgi:hypothetical protein
MTTSRINAYRWPARLVSHKPFAAERYFITSSSIWQVLFAENYDFSFLFSLFCQWPYFLCKMHNLSAFCRWKTPPRPFAASVWAGKAGVIPIFIRELPPSKPVGVRPLRLLTTFASTSPKGRGKSTAGSSLVSPNTLSTGFKSWLSLRERLRGRLSREKGVLKSPQAFQNPKIKIILPLNMARAQAEAISNYFFFSCSSNPSRGVM